MIDLTDQIVLGDRVRRRCVKLAAMHDANANVRLADVDVAHLLVGPLLGNRLLDVGLQFVERNVCPRAHLARGLRVSLLRAERGNQANGGRQTQNHASHSDLPIFVL